MIHSDRHNVLGGFQKEPPVLFHPPFIYKSQRKAEKVVKNEK